MRKSKKNIGRKKGKYIFLCIQYHELGQLCLQNIIGLINLTDLDLYHRPSLGPCSSQNIMVRIHCPPNLHFSPKKTTLHVTQKKKLLFMIPKEKKNHPKTEKKILTKKKRKENLVSIIYSLAHMFDFY